MVRFVCANALGVAHTSRVPTLDFENDAHDVVVVLVVGFLFFFFVAVLITRWASWAVAFLII